VDSGLSSELLPGYELDVPFGGLSDVVVRWWPAVGVWVHAYPVRAWLDRAVCDHSGGVASPCQKFHWYPQGSVMVKVRGP
jgi:hypothetical protein